MMCLLVQEKRICSSGEKELLTVRVSKLENCVRIADGNLMMVCSENTQMVWDLESDTAQSLEVRIPSGACACVLRLVSFL
jgi:hypothetical protein